MRGVGVLTNIIKPPLRDLLPLEINFINQPIKQIYFMNLPSSTADEASV